MKFLLAIIDSWDGTELMQVLVDGSTQFNNSFQLALGDTTTRVGTGPAPGLYFARVTQGANERTARVVVTNWGRSVARNERR